MTPIIPIVKISFFPVIFSSRALKLRAPSSLYLKKKSFLQNLSGELKEPIVDRL